MKASYIKKSIINGEIVQIKVPYKNKFTILRENKVYFLQMKDTKTVKYVEQEIILNRPIFMLSDNDFLQAIASKNGKKINVLIEEMTNIQTSVKIVDEYELIKTLENLKQQKLGIMNMMKYEEIINMLKENLTNRYNSEYINDSDNILNEHFIIINSEKIESINIKYVFPGEYQLESKKILFDKHIIGKQKVKVQ